jgi:hypothetical protein
MEEKEVLVTDNVTEKKKMNPKKKKITIAGVIEFNFLYILLSYKK